MALCEHISTIAPTVLSGSVEIYLTWGSCLKVLLFLLLTDTAIPASHIHILLLYELDEGVLNQIPELGTFLH